MIYLDLLLGFLRVGCFAFGGAYGAIPLIRDVVLSYGWLTDEQLSYMIAVSESTPGPIMVNMATYIGSSQAGLTGALIATFFVVLPILLIVYYSFVDKSGNFTLDNFITVFSDKTNWIVIGRSILIAFLNTLFCILIGYPIAYFLANKKFNRNKILVYVFIIPMWINFVIRTIATKEMLDWFKINSANAPLLATMIGMLYNYLPFAILPLYTTMLKLDQNQIEASMDLGANPARTFIKIIIPMSMPGIVSAATMTFMPTMSSYVIADKLGGGKTTLIGNLISFYFDQANYYIGSVLAIVMLVMIGITLVATKNQVKDGNARGGLW